MGQMSKGGSVLPYSAPAFWAVPASTEESAYWGLPDANPTDPSDLSGLEWSVVGDSSQSTTDVSSVLKTPSVEKIGSASSAANGISANPKLISLFKSGGAGNTYADLFGAKDGFPFQGAATGVCLTDADTCSFPSMMAMDG